MERTSAVGYKENETDVNAVRELAEDVRDAVMEYQASHDLVIPLRIYRRTSVQIGQQTAIYEQNCALIVSIWFALVELVSVTHLPPQDSGQAHPCLF